MRYSITEGAYIQQERTCVKYMLGTVTCYIHSCYYNDAHTLACQTLHRYHCLLRLNSLLIKTWRRRF